MIIEVDQAEVGDIVMQLAEILIYIASTILTK